MVINQSWQQRAFGIVNGIFMIFVMLVTLYPLWYVICASLSDPTEFIGYDKILFLPLEPTTLAYEKAFQHPLLLRSYINTLFVVVVGTALSIILTAITAYFMSRKNVYFKRPISLYIIFTMYFSGGLVPFYFTVRGLGLYDNLFALILPVAISVYNVLVMRGGFDALPESVGESARIDGAGHFTILFKIMIPLSMPTVAVIILYYGVGYWNAWFNASIFIKDRELYPLQLVLRQILISNESTNMTFGIDSGDQMAVSETIKHAITIIATAPILCLYPFLQKYFIKGIMIGAVKG